MQWGSSTRPRARLSWALLGGELLSLFCSYAPTFHLASVCRLRPLAVVSGYLHGFSDLTSVPKLHQSRASRVVCGRAVVAKVSKISRTGEKLYDRRKH
jgi:hypothetical protein